MACVALFLIHVEESVFFQMLRHLDEVTVNSDMQLNWTKNAIWALLLITVIVTSCTSGSNDSTGDAVDDAAESTASQDPTTTTVSADDTVGNDTAADDTPADEIVIRPEANSGNDDNNSWIGTDQMTDDGIQLVWDIADQTTSTGDPIAYRVYRLPTERLNQEGWTSPEQAVLTGDEFLYDVQPDDTGFTDETVETGEFYTYYLVGLAGPTEGAADAAEGTADSVAVVAKRWTTGLAVTDTEPPSPITDLAAEVTEDGVLLTWQPSSDNVEFASYSVSAVTADGQATYLGGGADPSQVSFLDNQPGDLDGDGTADIGPTIDYLVEAVDFHNNRGQSATITVTIP